MAGLLFYSAFRQRAKAVTVETVAIPIKLDLVEPVRAVWKFGYRQALHWFHESGFGFGEGT
jgi:hypothetical protein